MHQDAIRLVCSVALLVGRASPRRVGGGGREGEGSPQGALVTLLPSWHPSGLSEQIWRLCPASSRMAAIGMRAHDACRDCVSLMYDMVGLVLPGSAGGYTSRNLPPVIHLLPGYCEALLSCASRVACWPWCECHSPSTGAAGRRRGQALTESSLHGAEDGTLGGLGTASSLLQCGDAAKLVWKFISTEMEGRGPTSISKALPLASRAGALDPIARSAAICAASLPFLVGIARLALEAGLRTASAVDLLGQQLGPLPYEVAVTVRTAAKVLAGVLRRMDASFSCGEHC